VNPDPVYPLPVARHGVDDVDLKVEEVRRLCMASQHIFGAKFPSRRAPGCRQVPVRGPSVPDGRCQCAERHTRSRRLADIFGSFWGRGSWK
jgi:hypothetical protein